MKSTDADEKKMYVLHELCETEKSFLNVLELISGDFYSSLCDHLNPEDVNLLFSTAKVCVTKPRAISFIYMCSVR